MLRYMRLLRLFFSTALLKEASFRGDFLIKILYTAINLTGTIGGIAILFSNTNSLNSWTFADTLALSGVYYFILAMKNLFVGPSLGSLAGMEGELWTGGFDLTLLKPIETQFYVSTRYWSPLNLFDVMVGVAVMVLGVSQMQEAIGISTCLMFVWAICNALLLLYSILLLLSSLAFWYAGSPMLSIFDSIMQMGRFPVNVYQKPIQLALTWIVPVAFIVSIPAEALVGRVSLSYLFGGSLLAAVLLMLASAFFKLAVKKYASASS
ncbi:ABC-2 family transporter protein [Paenibacillus sp. FSL L8-0493]|uniref:ABC transporter permease n=1 Tax=unclassified Paenibacillus TaxID=185978 RepID=UPI0030F546D3